MLTCKSDPPSSISSFNNFSIEELRIATCEILHLAHVFARELLTFVIKFGLKGEFMSKSNSENPKAYKDEIKGLVNSGVISEETAQIHLDDLKNLREPQISNKAHSTNKSSRKSLYLGLIFLSLLVVIVLFI
ncbi:MAG: hypothetical protein ACKN92_02430 [Candidatus Nanopelagicaceae bacterium]